MSEADTVSETDRLPWLGEDTAPPRDHRTRDAIGLAIVAALLIFGVSYWIASQSWQRAKERADNEAVAPPAAAPLPKAPQVATRHQAKDAPRVAQRNVAHSRQKAAVKAPTTSEVVKAVADNKEPVTKPAAAATPEKQVATTTPAPSKPGRVVRIGTFASPVEAKLGWRSMVRAYPALAHLPATVVDASTSKSRPNYRFEIGTSQSDSDLLCQHMARIAFSCAVATR